MSLSFDCLCASFFLFAAVFAFACAFVFSVFARSWISVEWSSVVSLSLVRSAFAHARCSSPIYSWFPFDPRSDPIWSLLCPSPPLARSNQLANVLGLRTSRLISNLRSEKQQNLANNWVIKVKRKESCSAKCFVLVLLCNGLLTGAGSEIEITAKCFSKLNVDKFWKLESGCDKLIDLGLVWKEEA